MKPSICFVSPRAYNVLNSEICAQHIGGAEVQQVAVARGLAQRGWSVSFVTCDHGQPETERLGDITVYRSYREEAGLWGVRFVHPRITLLWAALRRANADIYYQRTSDTVTGVVAAFCRRYRRRFVFALGAMADCDPALPNCRTRRERWLYDYGLRRTDCIIAQTARQQEQLRRHFGRSAVVIRSLSPDGLLSNRDTRTIGVKARFLWVGRFCDEKRPELVPELAKHCPQVQFDVVGAGGDAAISAHMQVLAAKTPNVHLHGYVPYHRMAEFYAGRMALVCTSRVEGFPNTFLEAWSRGLPVLTTCDPDGLVAASGAGLVARDVSGLTDAVRRLMADPAELARRSALARRQYLTEHRPEIVLDQYEAVFNRLLAGSQSSAWTAVTARIRAPRYPDASRDSRR